MSKMTREIRRNVKLTSTLRVALARFLRYHGIAEDAPPRFSVKESLRKATIIINMVVMVLQS